MCKFPCKREKIYSKDINKIMIAPLNFKERMLQPRNDKSWVVVSNNFESGSRFTANSQRYLSGPVCSDSYIHVDVSCERYANWVNAWQ